ncbi:MAG TPA: site-2 protease family protein [Terriglobales bacterium]|nr:site-2 protease family protein [Terriglobales bacterium]
MQPQQIAIIIFQIAVFLFAISVHESAHAWVAWRRGDPTARMLGRISLNPIRHIDPVGTVVLPAIALFTGLPMIGWAKPVPVNPLNFRNHVLDDVLTSVAGPVSNFMVATAAVFAMALIALLPGGRDAVPGVVAGYDTGSVWVPVVLFFYLSIHINVLLAIFNLIPVPPLDGSHVLRHFLSEPARRFYDTFGMVGLLALVLFGGRFLHVLIAPVLGLFDSILMRL